MDIEQTLPRPIRFASTPAWHRWWLGGIMLATISLGWRYPLIGLVVPIVMLTAILTSLRRGRHACGHYCPRGAFFDSWFAGLAGNRLLPDRLQQPQLRWGLFILLLGGMAVQIAAAPQSLHHWGRTFWLACAVTTLAGIGLGAAFHARAWCKLCPIGTLSATLGHGKEQLAIAAGCKGCGACESDCPMRLSIVVQRTSGTLSHDDCIKCSACVRRCPQQVLFWPDRQAD